MRMGVGELAREEQRARLTQRRDDGRVGIALLAIGLQHALAGEERYLREVAGVLVHGRRGLDAGGSAELPVIFAVTGRDMDEAGALLRRDEGPGQQRHLEIVALAVE